jgi:hypothetical protein
MRKLISLSLMVLLFSLFSVPAFAGNAEDCNYLKDKKHPDYAPGLYGLCVAWHNADEKAADALADKFFNRAGFPVPGSEEPNSESQFDCPCWDEVEFSAVCELGQPSSLVLDMESGVVTAVTFIDFATFTAELFGTEEANCGHVIQDLMSQGDPLFEDIQNNLSPDEALDCQAELDIIAEIHLNNECPEA